MVASTETCLLRRIDSENLDTNEKIDLSGMVNIASARALTDPKTKEHIVGGQHYGDCLLDTCPMQSLLDQEAIISNIRNNGFKSFCLNVSSAHLWCP